MVEVEVSKLWWSQKFVVVIDLARTASRVRIRIIWIIRHFLHDIVKERAPPWRWPKLGDEKSMLLLSFICSEEHSTVFTPCHAIDVYRWLHRRPWCTILFIPDLQYTSICR